MSDLAQFISRIQDSVEPRLRQEAERLADDDAVRALDLFEDEILAEVILDDRRVNVRWARSPEGRWSEESDCEEETLHKLAACAVLEAARRRLARQPEAVAPSAESEEAFQAQIERRLARRLTPDEENYLGKLEKRFERVRQSGGRIYDQDMVRLHSRWSIQSTDPLHLWPETPAGLREFWDYVALALDEKKLPAPAFLRGFTDLAALRGKLAFWRQESTLPAWKERIREVLRSMDSARQPGPLPLDFRLILTPSEARLQARVDGLEGFRNVSVAELAGSAREHERGALVLPAEAELLLRACLPLPCSGEACRYDAGGGWRTRRRASSGSALRWRMARRRPCRCASCPARSCFIWRRTLCSRGRSGSARGRSARSRCASRWAHCPRRRASLFWKSSACPCRRRSPRA